MGPRVRHTGVMLRHMHCDGRMMMREVPACACIVMCLQRAQAGRAMGPRPTGMQLLVLRVGGMGSMHVGSSLSLVRVVVAGVLVLVPVLVLVLVKVPPRVDRSPRVPPCCDMLLRRLPHRLCHSLHRTACPAAVQGQPTGWGGAHAPGVVCLCRA